MCGLPDEPQAPEPQAYFAPCDQWRLPSDYVRHLADRFEKGILDPVTCLRTPRPLKRDQTLFLSQFAHACNAVWEDEQSGVPLAQRRCFNFFAHGSRRLR